jgi:lysylphosphatidylglycerol synthetase-like protein (DUF2156 family)
MISSKLGIIIFIYIGVFVVVMLDLWSGVRKAKKRGEFRSSAGYRRTVEKLAKYYNLIFAFTVTDLMQMGFLWQHNTDNAAHLPLLPLITICGALFICLIEIKSIFEASDKKTRAQYRDAAELVAEILKHKDKAEAVMTILNGKKETNDEDTDTE